MHLATNELAWTTSDMMFVFCDGGLANRIGSYVAGLSIAKYLSRTPIVVWPVNNRCGASFDEIFEIKHIVLPNRLSDFAACAHVMRICAHEKLDISSTIDIPTRSIQAIEQLREPAFSNHPWFFAENSVPNWIPQVLADQVLNELSFTKTIVDRAKAVIASLTSTSYYGIHLRGTDFIPPPPTEQMRTLVSSNPAIQFFICSDDSTIEQEFANFKNVFFHPKSNYVEKLQPAAWRSNVIDSDGLPYTSNINRSSQSVMLASTDLLLLGASTIIKTSHSSFLAMAERMRTSGFIQRQLFNHPS